MAKEADFYSAEETAKVLGVPERQVFGMLRKGELEGHQDEWARWRIPASALQRARRDTERSSEPDGSTKGDAGSRTAENEAGGDHPAAMVVRGGYAPLQKGGAEEQSGEETTQEANEYTVDEAAHILGLSPACVRQMLRAGELEGERREERLEGVLGPWRIPRRAVHALKQGDPGVLRAKRRNVCDADATTAGSSLLGEATTDTLPETFLTGEEVSADRPSEASELLSESVREVREKAKGLSEELDLLESRLELMEITESALREGLRRERERADRLQAELERIKAHQSGEPQEFWRRLLP
jgi:hypothetical protein